MAWASPFAFDNAGNSIAARIAMTAMTTSSSIRVNPFMPGFSRSREFDKLARYPSEIIRFGLVVFMLPITVHDWHRKVNHNNGQVSEASLLRQCQLYFRFALTTRPDGGSFCSRMVGESRVVEPPPVDRSQPYPSCDWLEGGLSFNRRSLNACLIVHHGRGCPELMKFNGGEIPVGQVLAARNEMIRQNQNGGHAACKGCPHLVTKRWPKPKFAFETIGIANFTRCNLRCNYCYLQTAKDRSILDGGDKPYHVKPVLEQLIREGLLAPKAIIDWGGGEPTIYPEFDSILELTTRRGASNHVHTNGTRFPTPLKRGLSTRKIRIMCSIDAGSRETYNLIKDEDLYDRVWKNLAEYKRAGCRLFVKYIVKEENCNGSDLAAFMLNVRSLQPREVVVDLDYDFPNPSPAVLNGMRELVLACDREGIPVDVGYTGLFFTPEAGVNDLVRPDARRRKGGTMYRLRNTLHRFAASFRSSFKHA